MIEFKESKFYKLLQDFFINNDKETFLQFLAEFYNRTEGIIDKDNVQDDLIKELRELYIEFNEKGIDENIIIEKVNYFLENNVKIKDILAKLTINTNNIKNLSSQMDTNNALLNEKINDINTKMKNKNSVNVKDFGAVGDGIADDTQALIQAFAYDNIEIPSGTYRVTDTISFENKNVFGSNMTHVTILGDIEDPKKPILAVGGQSVIRDITVSFADSRITGVETLRDRIGIQLFGGFRNLPFQTGAGIYNCQVNNCGTGISDGGASVFSANFKDLRISKFTCRGFEMTGTARTGNVYDNIYITNHPYTRNDGTGDRQKAWQGFVLSGEESECTITQLNIEHATLYQAIIIEDVLGLTAGSIHIEGVEPRDNWAEYVKITRTQGKIDNISFYYTRHKTGTSLIKFGETKKVDTTNDFYSDNVNFEIGTLVCKGLNRPDRATYGYDPNYPVSASTLSGSTQPFYFINRESAEDKYFVTLNRYNWMTYSYGFNDKEKYTEFSCNPHGSITFLKKAHMTI